MFSFIFLSKYFILFFERNPSISTFYDSKRNTNAHRSYPNLSNQSEHFVDLPCDVFRTPRTSNTYILLYLFYNLILEGSNSPQRHVKTKQTLTSRESMNDLKYLFN